MKSVKCRVINKGNVKGQAMVLNRPFSFIVDFEVSSGNIKVDSSRGAESVAGKILVCPSGKGGTVDPYIAYEGKKNGTAPLAILCQEADPIIALSAITADIPIMDRPDEDIIREIKSGDSIEMDGETGTIKIG